MSYSDQKFYTRSQHLVASALSFGTATASGAAGHTFSDLAPRVPKFKRRTKITAVKFAVSTIPDVDSSGLIAILKAGTATFGTAVLTDAALNATVEATITSEANSIFAADGAEPTIGLVGTSTASGAACGAYDIWFETQELPE
jgi:hypothetical protein